MIGRVLFLFVLVIAVANFGLAAPAAAQSPISVIGTTISPPTFDLSANPGDVLDETIRVTNLSAETVTHTASVEDFKVEGTEGQVTVEDDAAAQVFSRWFGVAPDQITLAPQETQMVKFHLTVPVNAEPGGHFATILFQPKGATATTSTGAQIVQRVGALILLKVSGAARENAEIVKFVPKSFVGSWDPVSMPNQPTTLVAKDEHLDQERTRRYFPRGPLAFDVVFQNNGNVHVKPTGTVLIRTFWGRKIAEVPLDPRNVFPGGQRRITLLWTPRFLWGVYYRAELTAWYGSQKTPLTAETTFWAFPLPAALAAGMIFLVSFIIRRRLAQALKILIRGR